MIRRFVIFCVLARPLGGASSEPSDDRSKPDFTMPDWVAISRADNDWVPYEDDTSPRVPIPAPVIEPLRASLLDAYGRYLQFGLEYGDSPLRLDEFCTGIFVVMGPQGLDAYGLNFSAGCTTRYATFLVHDTRTGAVTQQPAEIDTGWMSGSDDDESLGSVDRPLAAFEDIDGDGRPELVVERQAHRGTCCDAAECHYFHVAADASLTRILAVNDRSVDFHDTDRWIVKTVIPLGTHRIRLHVDVERDGDRESRVCLGDVLLVSSGAPSPFRVIGHRVAIPTFENIPAADFLFSACGSDAEALLAGR